MDCRVRFLGVGTGRISSVSILDPARLRGRGTGTAWSSSSIASSSIMGVASSLLSNELVLSVGDVGGGGGLKGGGGSVSCEGSVNCEGGGDELLTLVGIILTPSF